MKPEKAADFFIQRAKRSQPNALCVKKSWLRFPGKVAVGSERQSGSFLEQDSTAVPKFAFRSFCPCGNLVGECLPQTLLMRLTPLKNPSKYFFGFFKNSSASHPVFLLLVRGHHAQPKEVLPCENDITRRTAAG